MNNRVDALRPGHCLYGEDGAHLATVTANTAAAVTFELHAEALGLGSGYKDKSFTFPFYDKHARTGYTTKKGHYSSLCIARQVLRNLFGSDRGQCAPELVSPLVLLRETPQ